jgi:hypothetical protein
LEADLTGFIPPRAATAFSPAGRDFVPSGSSILSGSGGGNQTELLFPARIVFAVDARRMIVTLIRSRKF